MTPEEKARVKIDKMFGEAGWKVVDRDHYAPNMSAVAIKEGLLKGNKRADYFLFINGKAVGVLEAKREEIDVLSPDVCEQAANYTRIVPSRYQTFMNPLPLIYQSNGNTLIFKDNRNEDSDYEKLNHIHTPKEIAKILGIEDEFAGLPSLTEREIKALRNCQKDAVVGLEKSFREGKNRALMVLATGAGKTYTACMVAYIHK